MIHYLLQGDRILRCSGEHRQQVVFVETTEKPFLSQAHLVYMRLSQSIESIVPHRSHIVGSICLSDAAAVFIASDV